MASITTKSFGVNIKIMEILNMYPPDNATIMFKVRAFCIFTMLIPPVPVFGILYFLLETNFTSRQVEDNAFLIAEIACQVGKFYPFIANGSRIKQCINYFESGKFALLKETQQSIIDKCCSVCYRNSRIFLYSIIAGITFFAIKPIFIHGQKMPADVWLPFDANSNPKIIICVYAFIVVGVAYASFACAAIDPLIGGLLCLATGQIRVLKNNLQYLNQNAEEFEKTTNTSYAKHITKQKSMNNIIKHCVDHHNAILEFVTEYERCFSKSVFSQIMGSVLVICFCCLQLSKLDPLSFSFISMITFFSVVLAQIYVYCYYGTILFEESNSLTDAIYMGAWYECDIETRKSLMILIERSKKPIVISAGKILNLSVDTFTTILRRSYSLLAVLKHF